MPTLYKETLAFAHQWRSRDSSYNPELLNFFDNGKGGYNMCHYWSNFEIGSVEWLRSEAYTSYFDHLDKVGW